MNEERISTPNSDEKIKITADSNFKFSRFSLLSNATEPSGGIRTTETETEALTMTMRLHPVPLFAVPRPPNEQKKPRPAVNDDNNDDNERLRSTTNNNSGGELRGKRTRCVYSFILFNFPSRRC